MRATDLAGAAEALRLGRRSLLSLVGGGGKTTLLFALGRQLPARTLLTTTTRMGRDRTGGFPSLVGPTEEELADAFGRDDAVLVWRTTDERKALGFTPAEVDRWFAAGVADLGLAADPSCANFVLVRFDAPGRAEAAHGFLLGRGVITRRVDEYNLPAAIRVSVGDQSGCERFLDGLSAFVKKAA